MRSSKIYLIFILSLFLSNELMSQSLVDIKKQINESEICIDIQIDFDANSIDQLIITDDEGNEDIYYANSQAINWCYERNLMNQEKHIKIYAQILGETHLITPNYIQQSRNIVIVDGM